MGLVFKKGMAQEALYSLPSFPSNAQLDFNGG